MQHPSHEAATTSDEAACLAGIAKDPSDDSIRLVDADWVEERGDIRGEYLRLEHRLAGIPARLKELHGRIDAGWLTRVGKYRRLVLVMYPPAQKVAVIKLIRELTGRGLAEAKTLSETREATIMDGLSPDDAERFVGRFLRETRAVVRSLPGQAPQSAPGA